MRKSGSVIVLVVLVLLGAIYNMAAQKGGPRGGGAGSAAPTPAASATPTPSPSPTPNQILMEIGDTIRRFSSEDEPGAFERTLNFVFYYCDGLTNQGDCQKCTLGWYFRLYDPLDPTKPRTFETFTTNLALGSLDPKSIRAVGPLVRFATHDGNTITITIPPNSINAARILSGSTVVLTGNALRQKTSSWHMDVADPKAARSIAKDLRGLIEKSCSP